MKLHVTDSFDLLKRLPEPATLVTRQLNQREARAVMGTEKLHYAVFCDSVKRLAAEKALDARLNEGRHAPEVAPGDRVLVVGSTFREWTPEADTGSVCDQFWLVQIAL